jgi:hypothetical protein
MGRRGKHKVLLDLFNPRITGLCQKIKGCDFVALYFNEKEIDKL